MRISYIFLLFLSYSFIGWVGEVIYCSIPAKKFINRGFLYGPICPVYGFGGLLVMSLLKSYSDTWIQLFLLAMFVTSILEYLTSWVMEKLFHTKWWDYSDMKFQIRGRVCLLNSLIFGTMATLASHYVHPALFGFIKSIDARYANMLALGLAVVLVTDMVFTLQTLISFNKQIARFYDFIGSVKTKFREEEWLTSNNINSMIASVKEKLQLESNKFSKSFIAEFNNITAKSPRIMRLIQAYPKVRTVTDSFKLENIKLQLKIELAYRRQQLKQKKNAALVGQELSRTEIEENIKKQAAELKIKQENAAKNSFAYGLNFYKLFWVFFICSILGTIVETLYCLIVSGRMENRAGLIFEPLNPIYGAGGVIMTVLLLKLYNKRDMAVFAGSMVIGGLLEFLCSFFQDMIFHSVSWNYTGRTFSMFGGRTNFVYCIFWGFLGLWWVKDLYPDISRSVEKIPNKIGKIGTYVLVVLIAADILVSASAVGRMSARKKGKEASNKIEIILDKNFPDAKMEKLYPSMVFSD